jgi:hypothetical protein
VSAPALRADGSSFDRVIDALGDRVARLQGDRRHADARCPAHDDQNPSLTVDWTHNPAKGGMTLVRCHASGCDARDVVDAIGLRLADTYDTEPFRSRSGASSSPRARARTSKPVQTTKRTPARPPVELGPLEAEYPYADADGAVVGWMRRHAGKQFRWQKVSPTGRRVAGQPKPCPLYQLPLVLAAIADGRPVHLAEGEKDADALIEAGEAATTVPNGTTVNQQGAPRGAIDEYVATLRGAHVVIWADRDGPDKKSPERGYQGYRHAMFMRDQLAAAAASVRVVEAAAGKDAFDHLAAGHTLADAVAITPEDRVPAAILAKWAAAAPAGDVTPSGRAGTGDGTVVQFPGGNRKGGGGGGTPPEDQKKQIYIRDQYELFDGALVQVKENRDAVTRTELLNAEARIICRIVRDLGPGMEAEPRLDLAVTKDGQTHTLKSLPNKDFEDPVKWAGQLPLPLVFPRGHGKGKLVSAIIAVSGAVPVVTSYGLIGWREISPGEWAYLHAGGAIGKDGPMLGTRVEVSPRLQGFTLPPIIPEGDDLRAAYDSVIGIADRFPHRIAYPTIAAGARAILGPCSTSLFLLGPPATYKSGFAAMIQQMFMPSARYDNLPAGAGEQAATGGGLEQIIHEVGDAVCVVDDLAPDRGAARSAARAAELIRSIGNRQSKARLERDTSKGLRADKPPRAFVVLTGEDQPTVQSAERRTIYVPFRTGDVTIAALQDMGTPELVQARPGLAAALAHRVAGMMPTAAYLETERAKWAKALGEGHDLTDGLVVGRCNTVAELAVGLRFLLELVVDAGVVTREEARRRWCEAWEAFRLTLEVQFSITEGRSLAERFADLIRSALTTGRAHLVSPDGREPVNAKLYGWTTGGYEPRPNGATIGWTDGETIWLEPGAAFAVGEAEGRAQEDALGVTQRSLKAKLATAHPEAFEPARDGATPREKREHLSGARRRVWALSHAWLFPDDGPDPTEGDVTPPPPAPGDDDTSGAAESPAPAGSEAPTGADATSPEQPMPTEPHESQNGSEKPVQTTKRTTPAAPSVRPTEGRYAAAGVVVDVDDAYLVNGRGPIEAPAVDTLSELMKWALGLNLGVHHPGGRTDRDNGVRDDAGLVVVMPALARKLGMPKKKPDHEKPGAAAKRLVKAMEDDGWKLGNRGLQTYTPAWKVGATGAAGRSHFAVFPQWSDDPIFASVDDAALLAYRLTMYVETLGYQLVYNAGATGIGMLRQLRASTPRPLTRDVTEVPPPARGRDQAPLEEMEWGYWRELTDAERACTHIVGIDVNASYLAAAPQTVVGLGDVTHLVRPKVEDVRKLPGYVLLDPITSAQSDPFLPDLLDLHAGVDRARHVRQTGEPFVVTMPTLNALLEGGDVTPSIREAWVYDQRDTKGAPTWGKHLEVWAHTVRDAIYEVKASGSDDDLDAVQSELKLTYAAGLGQLASERYRSGTPMWLPYWNHATKGTAQSAIWRKAAKTAAATGRYPVGISRDAIFYAVTSDDPMPTGDAAALLAPLNEKGGFRFEPAPAYTVGYVKWAATATMVDFLKAQAVTDPAARFRAVESIWTTPKNDGRSE